MSHKRVALQICTKYNTDSKSILVSSVTLFFGELVLFFSGQLLRKENLKLGNKNVFFSNGII